jgi:hypothetical protein
MSDSRYGRAHSITMTFHDFRARSHPNKDSGCSVPLDLMFDVQVRAWGKVVFNKDHNGTGWSTSASQGGAGQEHLL